MANYVFKGLQLLKLGDLQRAIEAVNGCLAEPLERVSLQLHTRSLDSLACLVKDTSLGSRLTAFGWTHVSLAEEFPERLLRAANRGRAVWANREVYFEEAIQKPWYDWNGAHSNVVHVAFGERFRAPIPKSVAEPSQDVLQRFDSIIKAASGSESSGARTTSVWGEERLHTYSAEISGRCSVAAVRQLLKELGCADGTASWQLSGADDDLQRALETGDFRQTDYPTGCYHFNASRGHYDFAVQPHNLVPVLNCTLNEALLVAGRVFEAKPDIILEIVKSFVSWRLPDGGSGPRTSGNCVRFSLWKGVWKMFVGVEQFIETDPPVRRISPQLRKVAARLKAELIANNLMM